MLILYIDVKNIKLLTLDVSTSLSQLLSNGSTRAPSFLHPEFKFKYLITLMNAKVCCLNHLFQSFIPNFPTSNRGRAIE